MLLSDKAKSCNHEMASGNHTASGESGGGKLVLNKQECPRFITTTVIGMDYVYWTLSRPQDHLTSLDIMKTAGPQNHQMFKHALQFPSYNECNVFDLQ